MPAAAWRSSAECTPKAGLGARRSHPMPRPWRRPLKRKDVFRQPPIKLRLLRLPEPRRRKPDRGRFLMPRCEAAMRGHGRLMPPTWRVDTEAQEACVTLVASALDRPAARAVPVHTQPPDCFLQLKMNAETRSHHECTSRGGLPETLREDEEVTLRRRYGAQPGYTRECQSHSCG